MALMLCHQCLGWVEPLGSQCPQCDYPLDPESADPTRDALRESLGRLVSEIGEVRIVRTQLPGLGLLYETTNGLFFVPRRLEQVKAVPTTFRRPLRELIAASIPSPLGLLGKALAAPARMEVSFNQPAPLGPDDSDKLPALLMQNPGVFFLARRSMVRIRRTIWGWTIWRPNGLVLRFKPASNRSGVHDRMTIVAAAIADAVCP